MGLFEWFGELFNPGPVGEVDASSQLLFEDGIKKGWAVFFMILGLAVFGFFIWLIFKADSILSSTLLFIFYLLLAFFLTPRPDTTNTGWFGGLINDPFRISDDANRLAAFFLFISFAGEIDCICNPHTLQAHKKPQLVS